MREPEEEEEKSRDETDQVNNSIRIKLRKMF